MIYHYSILYFYENINLFYVRVAMKIVNPEAVNIMLDVKSIFNIVYSLDSHRCFSHIKYSDFSIFAISYMKRLVHLYTI